MPVPSRVHSKRTAAQAVGAIIGAQLSCTRLACLVEPSKAAGNLDSHVLASAKSFLEKHEQAKTAASPEPLCPCRSLRTVISPETRLSQIYSMFFSPMKWHTVSHIYAMFAECVAL